MPNDKTRKFFAVILLILLIIVPFIDWRLGAVMWMCAWLVFIFQKLFSRQTWNLGDSGAEEENEEAIEEKDIKED
jgi:energy-coupling factor transporter transmembrane protein EcfT